MLTVFRGNQVEWLAKVLAEQLRLQPPGPFQTIDVVVNTWPTSRWLSEQLAVVNGISAEVRFPFPGSLLRRLTRIILGIEPDADDPWKASHLVWHVLELLPSFLEKEEAAPLRDWLRSRASETDQLNHDEWTLVYNIAKTFDDYALYRPELINEWLYADDLHVDPYKKLPNSLRWQPSLIRLLGKRIITEPFGIQIRKAIYKLHSGGGFVDHLPSDIRFFAISSLARVQIELIQALSGVMNVQMFVLTPCSDLWQRCRSRREKLGISWIKPLDGEWFVEAPRLEAILGRMGAEFQQLVEGTGEVQLGESRVGNLFIAPANIALEAGKKPSLLEQLQQQLVQPEMSSSLYRDSQDASLQFFSCPGQLREVQLVRDQIIQWFAADPSLEPRDVLIMTPQVERFAPLIASVFNDISSTGVDIPWRITDRSQIETPGLVQGMLCLLQLAGERLTASSLQSLLANPAIQKQQGLNQEEVNRLTRALQVTGFRWGLDGGERDGDEAHSLRWCLDRWLLGLVFLPAPSFAPGGLAPFSEGLEPTELIKWWELLSKLSNQLTELRLPRTSCAWVELLLSFVSELFGEDDECWTWERQCFTSALHEWLERAEDCSLLVDSEVVLDVLAESLSAESGRFGHRSGALTISALEPMRAIPHRVIVLMGLDADIFPRHSRRPAFHLLEQERNLGDPSISDQDRYVLLEALLSARQHLLLTWNGRDSRTGEMVSPSNPVQQWLVQLKKELEGDSYQELVVQHSPNPLSRANFISFENRPPISCDRRYLEARLMLDRTSFITQRAFAMPLRWEKPNLKTSTEISFEVLQRWLIAPQRLWLEQLQLRPKEWIDPIEDLDAFSLLEWQRQTLLAEYLDDFLDKVERYELKIGKSNFPLLDWENRFIGQGRLPYGASGKLEQERLFLRMKNLESVVSSMGDCTIKILDLGDIKKRVICSENNDIIIAEPGRLSFKLIMEVWLLHLLTCVKGHKFASTNIVTKNSTTNKQDQYQLSMRLAFIEEEESKRILTKIKTLASIGLKECWPVPPESGWEYSISENKTKGSGFSSFAKRWQGGFSYKGESEKDEMRLCFGNICNASSFFNIEGFEEAMLFLHQPIIDNIIA